MAGTRKTVVRALVVEDDELLSATLVEALVRRQIEPIARRTLAEARASLNDSRATPAPELLVLDVVLPDGSGLDLLREIALRTPLPAVVAISGQARPEHSFELARLGVECFLPKPFELDTLERALEQALTEPLDLSPSLRKLVGKRAISDVENEVRATMVSEAMAKARSVSGAARLLSISRQLLQHILRDLA